jgi:hypothetical protein
MFKVIFRVLLVPAVIAYVVTTVKMVLGMKQFQAESATADDAQLKTLAAKRWDPFLVNTVLAVYIIWHIQPLVTPHHHGVWFVINALVAWVATTFLWELEWYSTKLFVPLKVASQVLLYASCLNVAFAQVGVSAICIILGVYFLIKHRELWTIAIVAIAVGVFSLLRSLSVVGAGLIIWFFIKIGGVIFFSICFTKSEKKGKIVCAIVVAILLFRLFGDVRSIYNMFVVMH